MDPRLLAKDFPEVANMTEDEIASWVETNPHQLAWLCVTPDTPVLMADGSALPIADVKVGDWIVGGDGKPDCVEAISSKPYSGDTYKIGPTTLTSPHRVATNFGWVPVGKVSSEIGVRGSDVIRLACVYDEVGWSVVRPVSVDVVDAFGSKKWSAEYLSRHNPMLHAAASRAHVPLSGLVRGAFPGIPNWQSEQPFYSAGITTKAAASSAPMRPWSVAAAALLAYQDRPLGWLAVNPVKSFYSGTVHDLSIAHSHSFVAGGIVVHNCVRHHRGDAGAHTVDASNYQAGRYCPDLFE
jgi:hypothetical protein